MTAYTTVTLHCDHFDKTAPAGQQFCHAGEYGSYASVEGRTATEARKKAAALGWIRIPHPMKGRSWRRFDQDICPAHPAVPAIGGEVSKP